MGKGELCLESGPCLVGSVFLSPFFSFVAEKTGALDDVVGRVRTFLLVIWSVFGCSVIDCVLDLVN